MLELIGLAAVCLGANALINKNNPNSEVKKNVDTRIQGKLAGELSKAITKALLK